MSYSKELLVDNKFKSGFFLQGVSPVLDQRKTFTYLDYNKDSIKANEVLWIMSQWWTPYNFKDANFLKIKDGLYSYENESRKCFINTSDGSFRFILDSYKEYLKLYGKGRNIANQSWSHFLLEQDLVKSAKIKDLESLFISLDFKLNEVVNLDENNFNKNYHTAQFLWYLTIKEGVGDKKEQLGGNFIWFGIPLYDYRYSYIKKYIHYDGDFAGSTHSLIYNLDSRIYIKDAPIKLNTTYHICLDILPYIKRAIRYAIKNKIFTSSKNLVINYMNIGWELPGSFKVDSEISNLSIEGVFHD